MKRASLLDELQPGLLARPHQPDIPQFLVRPNPPLPRPSSASSLLGAPTGLPVALPPAAVPWAWPFLSLVLAASSACRPLPSSTPGGCSQLPGAQVWPSWLAASPIFMCISFFLPELLQIGD